MTLKIALDSVVIHETPLEEIHFDTNTIAVTFADADEKGGN